MTKYRVKKTWNGLVSVRDYIVKDCIDKNDSLCIIYKDKSMTIPANELKDRAFQCHKTDIRSKFNSGTYQLYDFKWEIDDEQS